MKINLPDDLKQFILEEVNNGHFASEEAALAEAVRLLRRQLSQRATPAAAEEKATNTAASDPLLGALRDVADDMDEIVAGAMKHREQEAWRLVQSE